MEEAEGGERTAEVSEGARDLGFKTDWVTSHAFAMWPRPRDDRWVPPGT